MKRPLTVTSGSGSVMESIDAGLELLEEIIERYQLSAVRPALRACRGLQREREHVSVAVLGRFKAGKSSFLNDLAGRPLLPVGVLPVTTVVTRLCYGPAEKAWVQYQDGRQETVTVEEIAGLVSEAENPDNRKQVERVSVELPSLKRYRELQFIDTPGLDSAHTHNTEATLAWLPNVAIALVAISVDAPLSQHDLRLLTAVGEHTPAIAVLLTKADLVSDAERREIESFIVARLQQALGKRVAVFPYSVRPGHEALRRDLEERLLEPLLPRIDQEVEKIAVHKLNALRARCVEYLGVALEAARRRDRDRDALNALLLGERAHLEETESELRLIARQCSAETRPFIMDRMRELHGPLAEELRAELDGRLAEWQMNLWRLSRAFERWLWQALSEKLACVSAENRMRFCAPIAKACRMLSRSVQAFHGRLAENVFRTLGTPLQAGELRIEVQEPAAPDISVGRLYDTHWDLLWFLIPMSVFRRSFDRYFRGRVPYEVEKNLSRLATQWSDAIGAAITAMERQAREEVRAQLETIAHLLSQTSMEAPRIEADLAEIERAGVLLRFGARRTGREV
jgi:GTP-binding protein EngB required for normal cell division